LGWKRICGSDVTKCYQQAAGLTTMIADELERQFLAAYFDDVCDDNQLFQRLQSCQDAEAFAIFIAEGYLDWLDEKRSSTTDEVFRMAINFMQMINLYREFRLALNTGDAIMIEWLYKEFLPLYAYTGKKHYFEIVCGMMDELYGTINYKLLHLTRINRTVPLYTGVDTDGRPMANWPIDGLIELVQKFYHKMNFRNDNLEGWMQHSPHLQFNNKAVRMAKVEYHRVWSETEKSNRFGVGNENDLDQKRNRKKSSKPKRFQEHLCIAEFLQLNSFSTEEPGRKYNQDSMYKSLARITTELDVETEAEKSTRWMDKVVSVEEQDLASMVDRVFDSSERVNSSESDTADVANDVVLQFNEIGLEGGDDDDDGDNDVDESSNTSGGADSVVIIGHGPKKRKVRVRKAKVNALAFTDVIKCAKDKLAKRNLTVSRHRRLIREDKERNRKKRVLDECNGSSQLMEEGTSALIAEAMNRLHSRQKD